VLVADALDDATRESSAQRSIRGEADAQQGEITRRFAHRDQCLVPSHRTQNRGVDGRRCGEGGTRYATRDR
jgi:hypothetical protein